MRGLFRQFALIERLFRVAERDIALLFRCQPKNAKPEQQRLLATWSRKRAEAPRFVYDPVPDLSELRNHLEEAARRLTREGPLAELYARRAAELVLETRIVEAIATRSMRHLAALRFVPGDLNAERGAFSLARRWSRVVMSARPQPEDTIASDDLTSPLSLLRRTEAEVGRLRLPVRVEPSEALSATAATGDGVILVAVGKKLRRKDTERIVAHEVFGHALPRERAKKETHRVFAVGSAWGNDEQEGFALHTEGELGHLDHERKRELGLRHLAAVSVHEGADWVDTTRHLLALGARVEEAVSIASRVHRGGGLAREYAYLPSYLRVHTRAAKDPAVLEWLGRGRVSLDAIDVLCSLEQQSA